MLVVSQHPGGTVALVALPFDRSGHRPGSAVEPAQVIQGPVARLALKFPASQSSAVPSRRFPQAQT